MCNWKGCDVMDFVQHTDKIWTIENFLKAQHCDDLILFSEHRGYEEAKVSFPGGAQMVKGLRNNYRLIFEDQKLAQTLYHQMADFLPVVEKAWVPKALGAIFRFYRYDNEQRFKRHIDGRVQVKDLESRLTFMVYLNDDFEGGETKFDDAFISPKIGMALLFVHEQKHESLPIKIGRKYVLRSDILYQQTHDGDGL